MSQAKCLVGSILQPDASRAETISFMRGMSRQLITFFWQISLREKDLPCPVSVSNVENFLWGRTIGKFSMQKCKLTTLFITILCTLDKWDHTVTSNMLKLSKLRQPIGLIIRLKIVQLNIKFGHVNIESSHGDPWTKICFQSCACKNIYFTSCPRRSG